MDKYSNLINEIAVCGEEDVINRLQKVAQTLAIGNEDLADYLSLAIKIATNNEKKNSKISLAYIKNKLSKEAAENFEKEYEKEKDRAKQLKLNNYDKVALLSAMIKTGINE